MKNYEIKTWNEVFFVPMIYSVHVYLKKKKKNWLSWHTSVNFIMSVIPLGRYRQIFGAFKHWYKLPYMSHHGSEICIVFSNNSRKPQICIELQLTIVNLVCLQFSISFRRMSLTSVTWLGSAKNILIKRIFDVKRAETNTFISSMKLTQGNKWIHLKWEIIHSRFRS